MTLDYISATGVSILLILIWGTFYFLLKKRIKSAKGYFLLLLFMGSAGLVFRNLPLMGLSPEYYNPTNIMLFAILMICMILPWIKFDIFLRNMPAFCVNAAYIPMLKTISLVIIVLSFYAIIYTFPTAIYAFNMGAAEVRNPVGEVGLLPKNLYTTIAVASGCLSPVAILLFYISFLSNSLRKYTFPLFISSFAYIITTMAFCARDGFVYTPLMFIFLFLVFFNSFGRDVFKRVRRYSLILLIPVLLVLAKLTFDRFGNTGTSTSELNDDLIYGTWGYFYQQPYVFDHILTYFYSFYGFERRLKFLDNIIPLNGEAYVSADKLEYMFGTQLGEFYEIAGYLSLFLGVLIFVVCFYKLISHFIKKSNYTSLLLCFTIYLYCILTGLFYFRIGVTDNVFFLYVILVISSFFIPRDIILLRQYDEVIS